MRTLQLVLTTSVLRVKTFFSFRVQVEVRGGVGGRYLTVRIKFG